MGIPYRRYLTNATIIIIKQFFSSNSKHIHDVRLYACVRCAFFGSNTQIWYMHHVSAHHISMIEVHHAIEKPKVLQYHLLIDESSRWQMDLGTCGSHAQPAGFFSRRPQGRVQVQQANTQKRQEKPLKNTKKHANPNKKKRKTLKFGRFLNQRCHPQLYRFALVWRWCQSKRRHS